MENAPSSPLKFKPLNLQRKSKSS